MGKKLRVLLIALLIILTAMQFYHPQKNDNQYREVAAFETETGVNAEVKTILESKCYDCHSNQTVYPWYANVAPVSLWIDDHIVEGREHFDASEWVSYDIEKKDHKLEELIEEVEEDKMPLPSYTWIHGNISGEEKEMLIQWAREARVLMASVAYK
jgi:hypothetical protein